MSRNTQLAVPLVLVNTCAVWGQAGWAHDHITGSQDVWGWLQWVFAAVLAVTVESVAIWLAMQAHRALLAGDAALRLRLASYGVGALVATSNYNHWMRPGWRPTAAALLFAAFSMASPWLWGIHSRFVQREQLRARGLVDEAAVRFSTARWMWWPKRTFVVWRLAVWEGERDPAEATRRFDPKRKMPALKKVS